jgi:hypothetical protein
MVKTKFLIAINESIITKRQPIRQLQKKNFTERRRSGALREKW